MGPEYAMLSGYYEEGDRNHLTSPQLSGKLGNYEAFGKTDQIDAR